MAELNICEECPDRRLEEVIEEAFKTLEGRVVALFTLYNAEELCVEELEFNIGCAVFDLRKTLKLGKRFQ